MSSLFSAAFQEFDIAVKSDALDEPLKIHGVHGRCTGDKAAPALLCLHGFPQNCNIWHKVAPALLSKFNIVCTDLRGYGLSDKPPRGQDDVNYTKREMANDQVQVMHSLGYKRFYVLGHDRGARVTHRLARDHPQAVIKMILIDITPTLEMYKFTNAMFATAYYHWFLYIQPYPIPENLIEPNVEEYIKGFLLKASKNYDANALNSYASMFRLPGAIEGTMADYRASKPGGLDAQLDEGDIASGNLISQPMRIVWGSKGIIGLMGPEKTWKEACLEGAYRGGREIEASHYIPEDAPQELITEVLDFFC